MALKHEHIPEHEPKHGPRPQISSTSEPGGQDRTVKGERGGGRASSGAIDEGLQAIYGDDRSDLKVVQRGGTRFTRILNRTVIALALLAILAYGVFFIYTFAFDHQTRQDPIAIQILVPAEVKSGEQVRLEIDYQNPTRVPLAALELDLALPSAFAVTLTQPEPTDKEELVWSLGSLGPNSDGQIVLEGVWLSAVPSETDIQVLATYRPGNFNANFSYIATSKLTTLSSVLSLDLAGPETAGPGETLTYTAKLKNTGSDIMYGTKLHLSLPSGFILNSSTPSLEPGAEPIWSMGDISPEQETSVIWTGAFATDVSDVQQFNAHLSIPEADRELTQTSANWATDVTGSPLRATLVVNGNTDKATTELGGTLRLTLRLENTDTVELSGATARLDFKPDSGIPIMWDEASLSGAKLTSQGIVFDSAVVGTLKPGEKKTYNLSFPIKSSLAVTDVDEWTGSVFVTQGGLTLQTPPLSISMKATAELSARARYYTDDGAPLGTGPLPPQVGQPTTYRISWSIDEAVHDLDEIVVSATLPSDVTWENQTVANLGSLNFDTNTQTISWSVASLPNGQAAAAEFSLKLTPGLEDIGTYAKLLSGTILRATDAKTLAAIVSEAEFLTTELINDTFASGRGAVIE